MAITTDFIGHIGIEPALDSDQIERLAAHRAAAPDEGQPRPRCGWVASEDGRYLTHDGDEKYGDPAGWLRYLVRSFLKPRELRATGMVVGCRRDTKELFAIQVGANRVTEKVLWPRSSQSRETRPEAVAVADADRPGDRPRQLAAPEPEATSMTTLGNTHDRLPDWQVTAVFDPDGAGKDFAYTVGLFERELPELHLWARPSLGDDPGADWKFSPRDCCGILNELAWQLIDRELAIGDTWERAYDDGMVTARFRLDPPGDRDELEAFGIAPGASVLPVRWSLHRRPIGRPRPLDKRGLQRATTEYAAILARLGDDACVPDGWTLASTFVADGEFGPLTPMVAGRVAEFWSADAVTLSNVYWVGSVMDEGGGITWPIGRALAVARDFGRVEQANRTQDLARELVESRLQQPDVEDGADRGHRLPSTPWHAGTDPPRSARQPH